MNESLSEFESNLRKTRPVGCDELAADTFYRAGWEACVAKSALQTSKADVALAKGRRPIRAFSVGLICGLIFAGAPLFFDLGGRLPTDDALTVVAVDAGNSEVVTSIVWDDVFSRITESVSPEAGDGWSVFLSEIAVWQVTDSLNSTTVSSPAEQPLSPVARRYWSSLVTVTPETLTDGDHEVGGGAVNEPRYLRSSPLNSRMIDELL